MRLECIRRGARLLQPLKIGVKLMATLSISITLAVFLFFPITGMAQNPGGPAKSKQQAQPPKENKRDPELQTIIDLTAGVPPEFAADVLIRLVQSNKVADRALRIDLLKKAFNLAEGAQQPIKRTAQAGSMVDTRSGYLASAFGLNMDMVSLRSRAIDAILPLNAKEGRELFEQIRFPDLAPLACDDPLGYDPSPFYQTLANVVRSSFTPEDKLKGRHVALLTPYISQLQSHAQVEPVAHLLRTVELSSAEFGEMTNSFANSLQRLRGDERSFATAITRYRSLGALIELSVSLERQEIPNVTMLRATRTYLVSNLGALSCGEIAHKPGDKNALPEPVLFFNQHLERGFQNAQLAPISAEELQGARVGQPAVIHPYWQTPTSNELLVRIKRLRFGSETTPLSIEQRMKFNWTAELTDLLKAMESWKLDSDESGDDFFHQKSVLYIGLIDLIPPGPDRENVINSFVEFLDRNYFQRKSPMEWFWHVTRLLRRNAADWGEREKAGVLKAFLNTRDPILHLYARSEQWAPQHSAAAAH